MHAWWLTTCTCCLNICCTRSKCTTRICCLSCLVLLCTQVEDPSKYGVVVMDDSSHVERFVEKPKVGFTLTVPTLLHTLG